MIWVVLGEPGVSFQVNENGFSISGKGSQQCSSMYPFADMSKIKELPAEWTVYRASEASEAVSLFSLDATTMKTYLDADTVKQVTKPISLIKYFDSPADVFFCAFLPDAYFANVWELAKLIISHPDMSYRLSFGFDGFMPQKARQHPNFNEEKDIIYEEWLAGRPYISKEDFAFVLEPIRKEKREPSEKEKYSFDPTQTGI